MGADLIDLEGKMHGFMRLSSSCNINIFVVSWRFGFFKLTQLALLHLLDKRHTVPTEGD